ncbi:MAG: hypothetical protein ABJE47_02775 [bacterium]
MSDARRWTIALGLVGALALAMGLIVIDHLPVGAFHDDAMYVILAKSIATGQGYRYLNIPGAPTATHFPPGYPAVLALLWRVAPGFPANLALFKTLNATCFAGTAILMSVFARDRLQNASWAIVVGVLSAISVPLLVLVTMVLSEPLFLLLLVATLLFAERHVAAPSSFGMAALAGAWIGVLTLVRTHGIVVLPAVVLPLLVRRRVGDAIAVVIGTMAIALPWQLWSGANGSPLPAPLAGNYGSYIGWWTRGYAAAGPSMIWATLSRTLPEVGAMLSALFSPARSHFAHTITLVALLALVAIGAAMCRRRAPVTLLFLAGYATIVLVWPFPPSRFVWGVWPLFLFLLVVPATRVHLTGTPGRRAGNLAILAMLMWLGAGYAAYETRAIRGRWWGSISRSASQRIEPAIAWTRQHTSPSDLVASDDEGSIYLYTGRLSVPVASFTTEHYLGNRTAEVEAREGLGPLLATYPIRVVLVGSSRTFDAAAYLASRPVPILSLRDQFAGGAAFTVLTR